VNDLKPRQVCVYFFCDYCTGNYVRAPLLLRLQPKILPCPYWESGYRSREANAELLFRLAGAGLSRTAVRTTRRFHRPKFLLHRSPRA